MEFGAVSALPRPNHCLHAEKQGGFWTYLRTLDLVKGNWKHQEVDDTIYRSTLSVFFVRENERSRLLGLGKCQLLPQLNAIRCEATDFHLKTGTGSFDSVPI